MTVTLLQIMRKTRYLGAVLLLVTCFGACGSTQVTTVRKSDVPILSIAPITNAPSFNGSPSDLQALEQQVANAAYLKEKAFVPAPTLAPNSTHLASNAATDGSTSLSASATSMLAPVFTGSEETTEVAAVKQFAASLADSPSLWPLDGGIDWIKFSTAVLNGTMATLTGDVQTWSKFAPIHADGSLGTVSRPTAIEDFTATETQVSGVWLVNSYQWTFAPGSGP
jgi:hypothetical protein